MALNYHELAPGESFAYGYHSHDSQEELFVIQQGQVTFETDAGDAEVETGDVIRFAPGESQQGINTGEKRVVALAIGAPQATGETEILRECPSCEGRTPHTVERVDDGQATRARCLACGEQRAGSNSYETQHLPSIPVASTARSRASPRQMSRLIRCLLCV